MPGMQTRTQKTRLAPKVAARGIGVAEKPKKRASTPPPGPGSAISAEERAMLIARAAYCRAEKRGFAPGGELQDWIEAEAEVLQLIDA